MVMASSAVIGGGAALLSIVGGDPADFATAPLPAPPGDGGIVLGGASLWVLGRASEEQQQGAWEFIKFATGPEQQAQWHVDTGYLPVRLSAYDLPVAVERRQQFPQFTTAVDQLRESPDTPPARGALLGPFLAVQMRRVGPSALGGVSLIATFVSLVVTDLVSDGFSISGFVTWIEATVIVWLASLLAVFILPFLGLRRFVEERRD